MANILVTGAAGFIGAHVAAALARGGHRVTGCDRLDGGQRSVLLARLQAGRIASLLAPAGVHCERLDLCDAGALQRLMATASFDTVIHLAAEAGVRRSAQAPLEFMQANLVGFGQLLEACRQHRVGSLLYASSSSVYGNARNERFTETDVVDSPQSYYAATKMANEAMARAYTAQYGMRCMGMRFFTVFGPWGRPDMAAWSFAMAIRQGQPLSLYGAGLLKRDFTFVDDVVDAIVRLLPAVERGVAHEVVNIGHSLPVTVRTFVRLLEQAVGRQAKIEFAARPVGDVAYTCADDSRLREMVGNWRQTSLETAVSEFVGWLNRWEGASPSQVAAVAH